MATFQLVVGRQRQEIGTAVSTRIATDEPGGSARFYNTSVSGRLFLYEADSEPPSEITGVPVLPGSYWPEYWISGPPLGLWAWSNTDGLVVTVVLVKA